MSYCVNCGVELAPSERECPLCHTEVVNLRAPIDPEAPKPFPDRIDLFAPQSGRGFTAGVVTLLLALPAAVCLACDAVYTRWAGWSLLVAGALAMIWVFAVPALLIRRHRVLWAGLLDGAAVLSYLWLVERYVAPGVWFMPLAVPIVAQAAALFVADYLLLRKVVRRRFRQAAVIVALAPILPLGIEVCVERFLHSRWHLSWSLLAAIPCLLLALLLLLLDRRDHFKSQMKKRLHL